MKHEWEEELKAELKIELAAAKNYFEQTGHNLYALSLVKQRKVIEAYMEDHDISN